jgi:hypothetical protein
MRLGNLIMLIGAGMVMIGALIRYAPGLFSWFGNLPGDIHLDRDGSRVFIPITSMIVVSVAITLVANLLGWVFRDR